MNPKYTNPNKWSFLQSKSLKINKALVKNEKQAYPEYMADLVILVLFLISGAITGWIGVNWLPQETLDKITNLKNLKIALSGLTALVGLLIAFLFQQFRNKLTKRIRTMPTDLLISRSVGIVLGLVIATLLLVPVLLLPLPTELFFV